MNTVIIIFLSDRFAFSGCFHMVIQWELRVTSFKKEDFRDLLEVWVHICNLRLTCIHSLVLPWTWNPQTADIGHVHVNFCSEQMLKVHKLRFASKPDFVVDRGFALWSKSCFKLLRWPLTFCYWSHVSAKFLSLRLKKLLVRAIFCESIIKPLFCSI